jgi:hypothetical protein
MEKYISLPSGENVGYVSNLLLSDITPGANFSGMLPGGVCPRYGCAKQEFSKTTKKKMVVKVFTMI